MAELGFIETWTATCLLTGKEFECGRPNDIFECRHKDRFCCPNYLRHFVKGNNCKLAVSRYKRYDRYCLPSSLEPEVERLKDRSTVGLADMYRKTEELYLNCNVPETRAKYRTTLGAITKILIERKENGALAVNLKNKGEKYCG